MMYLVFFLLMINIITSIRSELPLVLNTWEFREANEIAWRTLKQNGKTPLDALIEGCSACEERQCDGTVGYGGSPDENGETTLDAMVMDGSNMNTGAVGGLKEIRHASRVARLVLEHTDHSLLVGDAASNFAEMMGFHRESLATSKSKSMWREWRKNNCQPNFWLNVVPDSRSNCGPYKPKNTYKNITVKRMMPVSHQSIFQNHDTIGMIVIDSEGHIFAGTSTNGANRKIPGRVGDSCIPGSGAYADNEVGAAVATGDGDIMMRFLPSLLAIEAMRIGQTPEKAANLSIRRIKYIYPEFSGALLVADKFGNYASACAGMDSFPYCVANNNNTTTRVEHTICMINNSINNNRR